MKLQFGIRSLLVLVFVIAFAIVGYDRWQHYVRWHETRLQLKSWAHSVDRNAGIQSHCWNVPNHDKSDIIEYSIHTGKPLKGIAPDGKIVWAYKDDTPTDAVRFFVIPGWKWVDDVDSAIEYWDNNKFANEFHPSFTKH